MQEAHVQSLGWEDPLENVMATHSSILAWRIPWTVACQAPLSMGLQRVRHDWATNTHIAASEKEWWRGIQSIRCKVNRMTVKASSKTLWFIKQSLKGRGGKKDTFARWKDGGCLPSLQTTGAVGAPDQAAAESVVSNLKVTYFTGYQTQQPHKVRPWFWESARL